MRCTSSRFWPEQWQAAACGIFESAPWMALRFAEIGEKLLKMLAKRSARIEKANGYQGHNPRTTQ
jgi:hypothetical protein